MPTSVCVAFIWMAQFSMSILSSIPMPSPASYGLAWLIIVGLRLLAGTAAGEDHFHALKLRAEDDPHWDVFSIPVTDTGDSALKPEEVEEMRNDMSADEFAREMLCSFQAPVEGAYYQEAINALQLQSRVTKVSPDLNTSVVTCWDLGIRHLQCIWLFQICGRELHWIDYIEGRGKALSYYADLLGIKAKARGFSYRAHLLPHDVEVKELATGMSRRHELVGLLAEPVITVPNHNTEDGITATRASLGVSWFDEEARARGWRGFVRIARGSMGLRLPTRRRTRRMRFARVVLAFR